VDKRAAALALVAQGLQVFPVASGKKAPPLVANWPERATADPAIVAQWWGEDSVFGVDANIGVHCKGLLVVDVDVKAGGNESLTALDAIHGIPETRVARTPTGGRHVYYRLPQGHPGVPNSVSALGPGLDVRSQRGYVLGPGSTRPEGAYEWQNDLPIVEAPTWLIEKAGVVPAQERERTAVIDVPDASPETVAQAEAWLRTADRAIEGQGGDTTTFRIACGLRDRGVSQAQAVALMLSPAWSDGCGWTPEEIETKVRNAFKYAQNVTPGSLSVSADDFPAIERPAAPRAVTGATPHLRRLDAFAGLSGTAPYLVKGILSTQSYAVIHGPPGEGKTFVALDLAYCVAAGRDWMGSKVRQGAVLYLAFEGAGGLRRRAQALLQHYGGDAAVPLYFDDTAYNLRELEGRQALGATIDAIGEKPSLVIVDTFAHALCGGDENSTQDVSAFNTGVAALIKHTGACVLVIHHPPKNGTGPRGSSALRGAIDTELEVSSRTISTFKQRDMELHAPLGFKLHPVTLGIDEDGDTITSCVVLPAEAATRVSDHRRANGNLSLADMAFHKLCDITPNAEPVSSDEWQEACMDFLPETNASRRTTWARLRTTLEKDGRVTSLGDHRYKRKLE
jgi:hypothetical protein